MKTRNCETGKKERDKALLSFFDEAYREFNAEREKLPPDYRKSLSNKVVYQKTAEQFFISETRVRVIISEYRGPKKNHRRKQQTV